MRRGKLLFVGGGTSAAVLTVLGAVSCFSDPREDDTVTVIDTCDVAKLPQSVASPTDPNAALSSLRAYVQTSTHVLAVATDAETTLRDACNAVNTELGLATSPDLAQACNPLASRISNVGKNEPPATPGSFTTTHFFDANFPPSCAPAAGALEACLSKCTGPCDSTKCATGMLAGKCNGDCVGSCTEVGAAVPCLGTCRGQTMFDAGAMGSGGVCSGECASGVCTATAWVGDCAASCPVGFTGLCSGTCTGTCDGQPINVTPVSDAGSDGGDAGDGGGGGGGGGPPAIMKPPSNADGNCPGKCAGVCSGGSNGACNAACNTFVDGGAAAWNTGFCGTNATPVPNCQGACRSGPGTGSLSTCNGTCQQLNKKACDGICRSNGGVQCNGTLTDTVCEGAVTCGQNAECTNACQAEALVAQTCTETATAEMFALSDPKLDAALKKHQGGFGKALNQLAVLRAALGLVGNRSLGDFQTLGLSGDQVRACVAAGRKNTDSANTMVSAIESANPLQGK